MKTQLQRVKTKRRSLNDHDFAIEHAAGRQGRTQWIEQVGEITVQRLFVAALNQNLVAIAKYQGAKAIPLGFKHPIISGRQVAYPLGEHGENGWVHGKVHGSMLYRRSGVEPFMRPRIRRGNRFAVKPLLRAASLLSSPSTSGWC